MVIRFFNTLTRKREVFKPLKNKDVKMFVCGLTVYDYLHLGHARTYAFYDTLVRFLRFLGFKVTYLQNVTDVGHLLDTGEDRMIKKAREEKKHPLEIADFYFKHELQMFERLKLLRPDQMPRATQHIKEIKEQIKKILENGYAYVANGSVYFAVSKFKDYGKLSRRKPEELISGARVEVKEEKKDPADFALWIRAAPEHIMKWDSPWSVGYPGWHIEDTAIAMKYFGPQYDIHGGAVELVFPHHEAEIAQAEATTGMKPYVKYWIHTGLLTINKERMGRSMGNVVRIMDTLEKYSPETLRMWIASTHYRKPLDYNGMDLEMARNKVQKITFALQKIKENVDKATSAKPVFSQQMNTLKKQFYDAMKNDMNTPLALTHFFKIISLTNKQVDERKFSEKDLQKAEKIIRELGAFFQAIPELVEEKLPEEISELIREREEARNKKDWVKADKIREQIRKLGFVLEDTPEGPRWRKVKD